MKDNQSVVLNNVSVRYRKRDSRVTSDIIKRLLGKAPQSNEFWALKNISFTLEKGDMLGVIGRNGAGKSTLMKAISGTLSPASGTIEKEGKLCALLELGTGFDSEMTVKENIYLRGSLLGYPKEFIDSKYDEIIGFADMRDFEDNAFRTLSSGMKSRVAFSIASMVEPDIIILDEVFAVGDGDFRKKSKQRMQSIIDNNNTTALMVSHSIGSVKEQCNKVLWLDRGRMVMFGEPETVCDAYSEYLSTGVLPKTESLLKTQDNPVNIKAKSKGRKLADLFVYLVLTALVAGGIMFWSQFELFDAYFTSRDCDDAQILTQISQQQDEVTAFMGVDTSAWNTELLADSAALVNDETSTRSLAKEIIGDSLTKGSDAYNMSLYAADLEVIKAVYTDKVYALTEEIKAEYLALGDDASGSIERYAFSQRSRYYAIEDDWDDAVNSVKTEIRKLYRANGTEETNADTIYEMYKVERSLWIAHCIEYLG